MSSGTREGWEPAAAPVEEEAARAVAAWVAAGCGLFGGDGFDFRGADFSGGDFSEAGLLGANLAGVSLVGADLYRADMQGADLSGADLTGACLVRTNLDEAVLAGAKLDGADLTAASLYGVDARGASCRGTEFRGAALLEVDLRGADLAGATVLENSFKVRVDGSTVLTGLTGSVFGPVRLVGEDGTETELAGLELQRWFTGRGLQVTVLAPGGRPLGAGDGPSA
ncbi:pentapeptide repeat-containing protein [Kitasatospora sp. NPDC057198]|uniref:pentapeptide repeat-containing protein n=1 Tax=Kitasatospora sp. NPDC057198 TaxID=3346046 RepID=UPI0036355337